MPNLDPHKINERLVRQVSALLDQLENNKNVTLRERFQALMAIARIQYVFVSLRREKFDEPAAGTAVRKYQTAFKNDAGGRKKSGRPAIAAVRSGGNEPPPDWLGDDDDGDGGGDAA
jgi:hypothetical protein